MSTASAAPPAVSTGLVGQPVTSRIQSIDIFRGFTMAVMIFVNDLSSVDGLSRWTYHIPRDVDAMSYVDMVYPFFLFAVGLSLPLAVRQRLRRNPSTLSLALHILLRCAALLALGLVLANAEHLSRRLVHLRGSLWALLALVGGILLWAVYPDTVPRRLAGALRALGAVLLLTMLAIFRRVDAAGHVRWIDFSYPEILGLIALTYLGVCILYIPTRGLRFAPLLWFGLLLLFNVASIEKWTTLSRLPMYFFPWDNGAMAAITMAGVVISGIFLSPELRERPHRQFLLGLGFALVCAVLGLLLRPLGISKIRATPTWVLWSVAAATLIFALFFWIADLRKRTGWAFLLRAPGSNTLLTYLLPDLTYFLLATLGLRLFAGRWSNGTPGVLRAIGLTLTMLLFSYGLTRARLRLQL